MAGYRAPLREMRFWLGQLMEQAGQPTLPAYGGFPADLVEAVLEEAAHLAEDVLDPLYRLADREGVEFEAGEVRMPEEIKAAYRQFADAGWVGLSAPAEFGGQALPQVLATAVNEIWKSANLAFSLCPMLTQGAIGALARHANSSVQRRFLPKMIAGGWTGTMNLTEPQAGSDLGALRAIAEPADDHYRLSGRKIFITWGDHDLAENIVHLVLARTPGAPDGVRGLSLFVVPKFLVDDDGRVAARNEVTTVSIEEKLGIHGSPTCVLSYGDGQGAKAWLVGEESRGLEYMFTMMNSARLAVGVEGLAMAERAYQQALAYSRERVQGKRPLDGGPAVILEHPDVRRMLMLMKAGSDAMRALCYLAGLELDRSDGGGGEALERASLLTPIVKGWCTETAQELASLGVQIHGGAGYIEETGAAQIMRDARVLTIYEGTTGIQANDLVGRKLIRDGGAALGALLDEVGGLLPTLAAAGALLAATESALRDGVAAARQAVDAVLARHADDPDLAGAVAVNLLMLMGTLLGGWQLAAGAVSAQAALKTDTGDRDWLTAKIVTAEFYAEHLMPRVHAYLAAVLAGSRTVMGLTPEQMTR